jgi:hypothetical protein
MYLFFFLCGHLKSRIYFNRPNNLEDLRHRIRAEMGQISPNIIERGVQCLHSCVSAIVGGGQFQHLCYILFISCCSELVSLIFVSSIMRCFTSYVLYVASLNFKSQILI